MIIVEGPDHTGKTALARQLSEQFSMPYSHYTKDSTYLEYLTLLCTLTSMNSVVDRWAFSEYPYARVMNRDFAFALKEWHNIVLLTLAQNPVIVLCTHRPTQSAYAEDQYLPYDRWVSCLELYRGFFNSNQIPFIEYDYDSGITTKSLAILDEKRKAEISWWVPMWEGGCGCIGSPHPDYLLVAERIGPNNVNNLPFETGPTGRMLSDMLDQTKTPLGKFAVTNMVKSFRRDPRLPNEADQQLLRTELEHLKPKVAVFMGEPSKRYGRKIAKESGIEVAGMTHFGYYSHRGITDISALCNQWNDIIFGKEEPIEEAGHRTIISST